MSSSPSSSGRAATAKAAALRNAWPKWRQALSRNAWAQIGGNSLSDIDPAKNPAINPNYPSRPEWAATMGQQAIILAWCGACFDAEKCRLWIPLSGGHADYAGNEAYYLDLLDDVPLWKMLRPPSGAIGNLLKTNDGREASGVYADGRARAIHSYNKHVFVSGLGVICSVQGSTSWSGQAGTLDTLKLDAASGLWTRIATAPNIGMATNGTACYDPHRHCVWFAPASNGRLLQLDLASMLWEVRKDYQYIKGYGPRRLVFLPDDDLMLQFDSLMAGGFCVWDMSAKTYTEPGTTGPFPIGLDLPALGQGGSDWNARESFAVLWHHLNNTDTIVKLTPKSDKRNSPWAWGRITPDAGGVVKPTERMRNGTFGRFGYSVKLDGYFLQNEVNQKTYFYAAS